MDSVIKTLEEIMKSTLEQIMEENESKKQKSGNQEHKSDREPP